MALKPTFAFLDESGNLSPNNPDRYFAVGAIIDSFPDKLIKELHLLLNHLSSILKRENDARLEFKFSLVKESSLPVYLRLIETLKLYESWRFCCLIVDTNDDKYTQPQNPQEMWEYYLRFSKLLLKNNLRSDERTILRRFLQSACW